MYAVDVLWLQPFQSILTQRDISRLLPAGPFKVVSLTQKHANCFLIRNYLTGIFLFNFSLVILHLYQNPSKEKK